MYRIPRYVIILIALLTSFPVKSTPGEPWTLVDAIVLIGGLGVIAESTLTLFRKGMVGKLQLVLGIPGYLLFGGNWLFRLVSSFPGAELHDQNIPHHSGYMAALVCGTLVVLACATLNLYWLLRRAKVVARET